MSQMYELVVKASGEVRDADGNLVSTTDAVFERATVSADQLSTIPTDELQAAGLSAEQIAHIKGDQP